MTGTVFDIGYQHYDGVREGQARARKAIYKDGVRIALGLGRGGKAKILPWFFMVVLSFISLVMVMVIGAANRVGGAGTADKLNLPSHADYYEITSIIFFVFGAIVAPELLCRDKREGTINLYLVRPTTGSDYIASRWLAFFSVMLVAAWVPQLILFLGLTGTDPLPFEYLTAHWMDVPRFLLAGAAMATYVTTLAMLTASFTTRRAYAAVFLVGLFVITAPFTLGASEEIEGVVGAWIAMFNLTNIAVNVNDLIFGKAGEVYEDSATYRLPGSVRVAWYFAWTLLPGALLWHRYRRLTP